LLKVDGRPLIRADNKGSVSMSAAKEKASREIKAFKERIRLEREIAGERALRQIGEKIKSVHRGDVWIGSLLGPTGFGRSLGDF